MFRVLSFLAALCVLMLSASVNGQTIGIGGMKVSVQGAGSVTIDQPGEPLEECTEQYPSGCWTIDVPNDPSDVFTFTAAAAAGWRFVEWTSDGSPAGTNTVITRGPFPSVVPSESLVAVFEEQPDSDDDGVLDPFDLCPTTPPGQPVDADGCADRHWVLHRRLCRRRPSQCTLVGCG